MLFQTFDDKQTCLATYVDNKLHLKDLPKGKKMTQTWSYSEFLKDKDVLYAQLYCNGKSLDEVCPSHLKENWDKVSNQLKAFHRSMQETSLDLNEHCFFDMVPRFFLKEYAEIKNRICRHVFTNYEKPNNYEFLLNLTKVLTETKNKKLNINFDELNEERHKLKVRNFIKYNKATSPYIVYDAFKTKTGRLSTKNSFPILTMDKTYRKIIKPNNDWFVEFDFNAAELRVLLGLLGKEQPQEDLHMWNIKNIFKNSATREEAKKRIFAWLYNPKLQDSLLNNIYDRDFVVKKYFNGSQVTTFFTREIEADKHHALNYIVQSTAADLFLRQMIKAWRMLKGKDSYIAFALHDSIVIDFAEKDIKCLKKIKEAFQTTDLGNFLVNTSAGRDFGSMKRLKL